MVRRELLVVVFLFVASFMLQSLVEACHLEGPKNYCKFKQDYSGCVHDEDCCYYFVSAYDFASLPDSDCVMACWVDNNVVSQAVCSYTSSPPYQSFCSTPLNIVLDSVWKPVDQCNNGDICKIKAGVFCSELFGGNDYSRWDASWHACVQCDFTYHVKTESHICGADQTNLKICESACGASAECDDRNPGTSWCDGNIKKSCDNYCAFSQICSSNCGAPAECNGMSPGTGYCSWGGYNYIYHYCDSTCYHTATACTSYDLDEGDDPLNKGTCYERSCDSASGCKSTFSYTDSCSGNTLTEYYPQPNSQFCSSKTYNCDDYDCSSGITCSGVGTSTLTRSGDDYGCSNGACVKIGTRTCGSYTCSANNVNQQETCAGTTYYCCYVNGNYQWQTSACPSSTTTTYPPLPDLVITDIWLGSDKKVYYTIKNQGNAAAGSSYSGLYVYYGDQGYLLEDTDYVSSLSGGASSNRYFSDWTCSEGNTFKIKVCADYDKEVSESNEVNNCIVKLLTCEICNNGKDDDGDGLIDCADPDCVGKTGPNGYICCQSDNDCKNAGVTCDSQGYTNRYAQCENNECKKCGPCQYSSHCANDWCCDKEISETFSGQCKAPGTIINYGGNSYLCDPPMGFESEKLDLLQLISYNPFMS